MTPTRIVGIGIFVVGLICLYLGLQATDSVGESIREGVTGSYTDTTTGYLVGGAIAMVVGGILAFRSATAARS